LGVLAPDAENVQLVRPPNTADLSDLSGNAAYRVSKSGSCCTSFCAHSMSIRVHVDGHICLPEEAKISVFDRGFLYGDSVYETIGTVRGRLFALSDHLDRLERSAARLALRLPPRSVIERAILDTVAAAGNPESRVRVMVTR